jgi:hypothetical protein
LRFFAFCGKVSASAYSDFGTIRRSLSRRIDHTHMIFRHFAKQKSFHAHDCFKHMLLMKTHMRVMHSMAFVFVHSKISLPGP